MPDFKKIFLDLLFPIQCLGCNREGKWLCPDCLERIRINPFNQFSFSQISPYLNGVWVAAEYSQPLLQNILHCYKYNFIFELGGILGDILIRFFNGGKEKPESLCFDFVVAIPLSRKRMVWRGFNQAEILAKKISAEFSWPLGRDLVVRRHHTLPQVGLKAEERKNNVKGAFGVNNLEILRNKKVLLIDDVMTTGATLSACAQVLKKAGAKEIHGLVVANG